MPTYGMRPEDVVVDAAGNVQTGAKLTLHATQADAQAKTNVLATVTTSAGRWSVDLAQVPVWVRTTNGQVYEIADFSAKADQSYVDTELGKKANASSLAAKLDKTEAASTYLTPASANSTYVPAKVSGAVPAGLGWTGPALSPKVYAGMPVGEVGLTPQALFDAYSTVRSAPAQTFYVSTSGNDSNGGTQAAPFRTLFKAVTAANAANVPCMISVQAGTYERSRSFQFTAVAPTVDLAIVATGGRVVTGTFDLIAPTADATFTSTYSLAVANCDRVVDTANLNRYGNYTELVQVDTAAKCDKIPGSWALVAGTLYVHRADEKAVTVSNTKVFRNQPFNFLVQTPQHIYIEGFDFEGAPGSAVARFDMQSAGTSSADKAVVLNSCSFKYGGGAIGTATVGLAVSSWQGIVAAFNCQADANATDGFNFHNGQGVTKPMSLTVNCSGKDNGRGGAASCQGLTYHETCIGIDVAGVYEGNRGGNIRNINTSKVYLLGTVMKDDKGDGQAMPPTGLRLDDAAEAWCERTVIDQPRGQYAYATGGGTAKVHRKDCLPVPQPDSGPGVFDTF